MIKKMEIDKAIDEFEKEQKKIEIALEFAEGDLEKAKKLVSGEIKDIAVIKCRFLEDEVKLFGAFIIFFNLESKLIEKCYSIISFDRALLKATPYSKWSEFESCLIDLQWKGKHLVTQSKELTTNIEAGLTFEYMETFIELLNTKNERKILEILKKIIIQTLNLETIRIDVEIEFINRFLMKYDGQKISKTTEKKSEPEQTEKKNEESYIKEGEILLEGELEISPIKGININNLQPGMEILVKLRGQTPQEKYFINVLNAHDGKKILPVKATIRYIDYDDTYGYLVIAELGPKIIVKCIEKAQINVMTPEIATKERRSKILRRLIILLGSLLFLIAAIYIYLSLKGFI